MKISLKNSLWVLGFLLVALAWLAGLAIDLTGDSGLYAAISRQMVESGNWLELKINGVPYDQKPHLFFWLAGLGIEFLGNTNLAYKLFLFLSGLSGIYFTYQCGRLLHSEEAGRLAALFTGTSQLYFLYFFDIHTDTVLQAGVILSVWQLAAYLKQKKTLSFVGAFTGAGLAMLTKGPVGAVIPFFFVLIYLLLKKDFRQLFHPKWIAGIGLVMIIISPTLYHLWNSFGADGLRFYFIDNNLGRVSGDVAGSSTDPFFYLYNLLWAYLPWTVPVVAGLGAELRSWFLRRQINAFNAALLGSTLILLAVYSIARGKAPNYLMLLMPPMAIVAAGRMHRFAVWPSRLKKYTTIIWYSIAGLMLAVLLVAWLVILEGQSSAVIIAILSIVALAAILFFNADVRPLNRLIFFSLLVAGTFNLFLNHSIMPALFAFQGSRQVVDQYESHEATVKHLYSWDLEEYELFFMASDSVRNIDSWERMQEVMEKPGTWLYTNKWKHDEILKMGFSIDTVFRIEQRGMNAVSLSFLLPDFRQEALSPNFLIKTHDSMNE